MISNICPVCGYHMTEAPRDFHICPSCGTEFGYDDASMTHEELRQLWLDEGAQWWSEAQEKPSGWNPYKQLIDAGLIDVKLSSPSIPKTSGEKIQNITLKPTEFAIYVYKVA